MRTTVATLLALGLFTGLSRPFPADSDRGTAPSTARSAAAFPRPAAPGLARLLERAQVCLSPDANPALVAEIERLIRNLPAGVETFEIAGSGRWTTTAGGGTGPLGTPVTLTYSFVPDGPLTHDGDAVNNVLHARLTTIFGTEAAWKAIYRECLDEWSRYTGIVFVEEANDDGAPLPDAPGVIGVRGDIRISMFSYDGASGVLGFNYFPASGGDQVLDRDEDWGNPFQDFRFFRNVVMHELGHGIALLHTSPTNETKLMEPFLTVAFTGPQDDDIRGGVSLYGDALESNEDADSAAMLAAYATGTVVGDLALHAAADEDWFFLPCSASNEIVFRAIPLGSSYTVGPQGGTPSPLDTRRQLPLSLEVYRADQETRLAADTGTLGGTALVSATRTGGDAGFYIRVHSESATGSPQRYRLTFDDADDTLRRLTLQTFGGGGAVVTCDPVDAYGRTATALPGELFFAESTAVTLTAPATAGASQFDRWVINGESGTVGDTTAELTLEADSVAEAIYGRDLTVVVTGNRQIVAGESTTLTAQASGGQFPYTYAWSVDGSTSGIPDPSSAMVTVAPAKSTTYTVEVVDRDGKSGGSAATVTVAAGLSCSAGPDQYVRIGETARIPAQISGGTPPYSIVWSPTVNPGNPVAQEYRPSADEDRTYTLSVSDAKGRTCQDSVTIFAVEALAVSIGDEAWVQLGDTLEVEAEITGGGPPYEIEWYANGLRLEETGTALTIRPEREATYLLIVRDSTGSERNDSLVVRVVPRLSARITTADTSPERGKSITLHARPTGGRPPYTYRWRSNRGLDQSSEESQLPVRIDANTRFTLDVADAAGFAATATLDVTPVAPAPADPDSAPLDGGDGSGGADEPMPVAAPPPCALFGLNTLLITLALIPAARYRRR